MRIDHLAWPPKCDLKPRFITAFGVVVVVIDAVVFFCFKLLWIEFRGKTNVSVELTVVEYVVLSSWSWTRSFPFCLMWFIRVHDHYIYLVSCGRWTNRLCDVRVTVQSLISRDRDAYWAAEEQLAHKGSNATTADRSSISCSMLVDPHSRAEGKPDNDKLTHQSSPHATPTRRHGLRRPLSRDAIESRSLPHLLGPISLINDRPRSWLPAR